jgi:hypothetical protein
LTSAWGEASARPSAAAQAPERLLARGQARLAVLDRQQGGVESLGRGLGGFRTVLELDDAARQLVDPRLAAPPLGQRPEHGADRQGHRAGRRRQDQFVRAHRPRPRPR